MVFQQTYETYPKTFPMVHFRELVGCSPSSASHLPTPGLRQLIFTSWICFRWPFIPSDLDCLSLTKDYRNPDLQLGSDFAEYHFTWQFQILHVEVRNKWILSESSFPTGHSLVAKGTNCACSSSSSCRPGRSTGWSRGIFEVFNLGPFKSLFNSPHKHPKLQSWDLTKLTGEILTGVPTQLGFCHVVRQAPELESSQVHFLVQSMGLD